MSHLVGPVVLAQTCSPKMFQHGTEWELSSGPVQSSWQFPRGAARAPKPLRTLVGELAELPLAPDTQ